MEKAKVYFSDLRTSPTSNLLDKMERLVKKAGIAKLPLKDSFVAIKIHFGEPGNLAYIRPNYAARMANLLRSYGAKPFLTDCNTLYSGRRANAVDHLESAMENGFNPISAQCQVIIADGLKGTDYREIPIDGKYCPAPKIGTAIADADIVISGHTHGGQVCLPFGLLRFEASPDHALPYTYPWHISGGNTYLITKGLGTSTLPLRFNCPPEIYLLELH